MDSFWDIREQYLRSLFPEEAPAPPPVEDDGSAARWAERQKKLAQMAELQEERSNAVTALRFAKDISEMKACGKTIKELAARIAKLKESL